MDGVTERINIFASMLWVAVLAVALWRAQEAAAPSKPAKLTVPAPRAKAVG